MNARAKTCKGCYAPRDYGGGRPRTLDGDLQRALGLRKGTAKRCGGAAKLMALDEAARNLLVRPPALYGGSRTWANGGLKARGFKSRKRGLDTQPLIRPHVETGQPYEAMMTDCLVDALGVE